MKERKNRLEKMMSARKKGTKKKERNKQRNGRR